MGRPRNPNPPIHAGRVRVPQANGWTYVYEKTSQYDHERQQTRTISKQLIGKIPQGSSDYKDMVSTGRRGRPSKKDAEANTQAAAADTQAAKAEAQAASADMGSAEAAAPCPAIPAFDTAAAKKAQERLNSLAKIPGSLGSLEDLAIRLAGITGKACPSFPKKAVVLFAGDHDIALHNVSASGQEVTEQQVRNFLAGGGTINAFLRTAGAELTVVDVGIKNDLKDAPGLVQRKVVHAARDFSQCPALTHEEALRCLQTGVEMAYDQAEKGVTLLACGEMGVGNTSPSSAITAVLTKAPLEQIVNKGSGIRDELVQRKIQLIRQGIERNAPNPDDAVDVLAKVGGAEIGAMAGMMLGAASLRIPCVLDGFIAAAAAAIALGIKKEVRSMLVGSHLSKARGHALLMKYLKIPTYFNFGMHLGEGAGAALFFPVVDSAVRILTEMTSLAELHINRCNSEH